MLDRTFHVHFSEQMNIDEAMFLHGLWNSSPNWKATDDNEPANLLIGFNGQEHGGREPFQLFVGDQQKLRYLSDKPGYRSSGWYGSTIVLLYAKEGTRAAEYFNADNKDYTITKTLYSLVQKKEINNYYDLGFQLGIYIGGLLDGEKEVNQ